MNLKAYHAYMPLIYRILSCTLFPGLSLISGIGLLLLFYFLGFRDPTAQEGSYIFYLLALGVIDLLQLFLTGWSEEGVFFGSYRRDHRLYDYMKTSARGRDLYLSIYQTDLIMGCIYPILPMVILLITSCISDGLSLAMVLSFLVMTIIAVIAGLFLKLVGRRCNNQTTYGYTFAGAAAMLAQPMTLILVTSENELPILFWGILTTILLGIMILLIIGNLRRCRKILGENWLSD